jgi:hypothetical protein
VIRRAAALLLALTALAGCGALRAAPAKQRRAGVGVDRGTAGIPASLLAAARPIGSGPRFEPPIAGPVSGRCEPALGRRRAAHIEVFGANRVVLLAAGIGTRAPRSFENARLTYARCFGVIVTVDPTGVVYFRPGAKLTLGDLFHAWGQELTPTRVASFTGGRTRTFLDGRRWRGAPSALPLTPGAEIVVEIGPYVPPHRRFVFSQAPAPTMR